MDVSKLTANELMRIFDDAIREALAARDLEAFRFDADICPEEGWLRVKIKIRPAVAESGR